MDADATAASTPWTIERVPATERAKSVAEWVRDGLDAPAGKKTLPPILFYDDQGSDLFVQITRTPEYYPTRTERSILEEHARELSEGLADEVTVIELGSGSSEKTHLLLKQLLSDRSSVRYVPIDISEDALVNAADRLTQELPDLEVHCIVAEYGDGMELASHHVAGQVLVLVLGGNLGNFTRSDAGEVLRHVRASTGDDSRLLIGLDLVKDIRTLLRAYDDAQGVTEAFNLNVLERINRELGGHFDTETFKHLAFWNAGEARMEMYLVSLAEQTVHIDELDLDVSFEAGEHVHTENSHKFTRDSIRELARDSGWKVVEIWTDDEQRFSLSLFESA